MKHGGKHDDGFSHRGIGSLERFAEVTLDPAHFPPADAINRDCRAQDFRGMFPGILVFEDGRIAEIGPDGFQVVCDEITERHLAGLVDRGEMVVHLPLHFPHG